MELREMLAELSAEVDALERSRHVGGSHAVEVYAGKVRRRVERIAELAESIRKSARTEEGLS